MHRFLYNYSNMKNTLMTISDKMIGAPRYHGDGDTSNSLLQTPPRPPPTPSPSRCLQVAFMIQWLQQHSFDFWQLITSQSQDSQDLSLSSWSLRFVFVTEPATILCSSSKTWSDTLARVWYCCKCWRVKISALSRRSSLCRRRQFSTTTTVKAPQSPRAVRSHDYQLLCLSTTTSLVSAMHPI